MRQLFSRLLGATETAIKRLHDVWLESAIEYRIGWAPEIERRKELGIEAPDPIPYPDLIEIDMRTGEVVIRGPMSREEDASAN